MCSWRCSCSRNNMPRKEPVFAGKVTCGVRNETSGQSGPSNTVAADPFTGQNRNAKCGSGIQHKRLGGWRPKTKTLYLPFQTLRYIGMAARGVLSSLPFSPINLDKGPSTAAMDVGWRVCQQLPDCRSAHLDRWTGEIALPRELGALDGPVLSDVSFEGSAILRAGGSTHLLLQATPDMGRTRWILILCAWTIVGLLFAVRRIVLVKVQGSHVSWVIVGAPELVYWYVWAAYTPLVIGLAKRFPLTGPRFVPHIAIHTITSLMMAPLASLTEYFLSRGLVGSVFRITDPGVLRLLPPFAVSVLSMSFTGMLTYWLVVGLYQSIHFYQAAMERQTIAAQLETQLSHAELENLKSQLHPHFLFNSLHTIGILMQEDVDAASHLLVCLGDLLRMALERRENEITLQSELEFVGKYLEIEQTRFHDRLKVHMDVPPELLAVYVPSLALPPLVENAVTHGFSVDSAAR